MDAQHKPLVINLLGGPSSGKSTQAAKIFSGLKERGVNTELITEYAKDMTWQASYKVLSNQLYIFGKQYHRLWRVKDQVDVIVTDAPLLASLVYGETSDTFKKLVLEEFNKFNNYNIFLNRPDEYKTEGRTQTLEQAVEIDNKVKKVLDDSSVPFVELQTNDLLAQTVVNFLESWLI